ncbi:sarcosine oxidase subunit gamma [Qingshengfaniella alkalisoli]|uniref:Sarcosine oxidase subunit gamma n=1 Tax=Qingshengfaniella alkalisoli TaxID=2599296 RepID=A0A5B8I9V7_9RHOB|nr:sarcosine oxidase subunit gamma [Qingshengfaniella alkalisoli]QDY70779.1 sarcosine oxidase subunit gamma [Qingshengfaniella alkalisoli]
MMCTTIKDIPESTRHVLRGQGKELAKHLELPLRVGQVTWLGKARIACLGPDEWMLVSEQPDQLLLDQMASLYAETPHALADVSDRELSLRISGPAAADVLASGCPRDLRGIDSDQAMRTICHGVEIILWREEDGFCVDAWRSFMPHLKRQLQSGLRDAGSFVPGGS